MRTIISTAAALALLSSTAIAQTTAPSDTTTRPTTTPGATTSAPATAHRASNLNPFAQEDVSKIEGTAVYDNDNSKVGSVSTVLMNPQTKKVDRLVVSAGGLLGVGVHKVALPLDDFTWDSGQGAFKISRTVASLKSMPEWTEGETATGSTTPPPHTSAPSSAGDTSR